MQRNPRLWATLFGVGVLALMFQLAVRLPEVERGIPKAAAATPLKVEKEKMVIAQLPCFECHNIKRYESGKGFAHSDHDAVGHCHNCHTFAHHAKIGVRRDKCKECHEDGGDGE